MGGETFVCLKRVYLCRREIMNDSPQNTTADNYSLLELTRSIKLYLIT